MPKKLKIDNKLFDYIINKISRETNIPLIYIVDLFINILEQEINEDKLEVFISEMINQIKNIESWRINNSIATIINSDIVSEPMKNFK